jgi:hypothetical protein
MRIRHLDFSDLLKTYERLESEHEDIAHAIEEARCVLDDAKRALSKSDSPLVSLEADVAAAESSLDAALNGEYEWSGYDEWYSLGMSIDDIRSYEDKQGIHSDDFEDYARDLHEDLHGRNSTESWPHNCIDWEAAAEQLKGDFSVFEYDGQDYYVRG